MAAVMPAKRPRTFTTGNDALSSRASNSRNKRARTSTPDSSDPPSANDLSSDSSDDHDSGSEEETRDQEQMARATQQVQRDFRATANKQNVATDSGIIEEVQCVNFMCHEHLTVPLGPLINFIIGHNGSGKSAVLTALTICLGGKATATNRAQNLKSLIKEGKEHSIVTVRIKNQGPLAFKPSQYGSSIIVERHFSRSGTSGFKLKDRNGRIVSTKKAELEDILDAFSMQIDNPMNVLTQDMARQFLNHSTPKDKYKFFLQGTQLENLNRDYQQIEQSLEVMNAKAEVKQTDLGVLRKQMEDLAGRARRAENLEKMRAKEAQLAHQAAWARVRQDEEELAKAGAEVARVDGLIEKRTEAVEEASALYEQADQAHQATQQRVTDITNEMEAAKQEEAEAKEVFQESRQKVTTMKADERKVGEDVKSREKAVKKYELDIEQHRQRQVEADNGLYAEKVRELEEAKDRCERAKEAFTSHDTSLPALADELRQAQKEQVIADQKVAKARGDETRIRTNINRLQQGQANWIDAYPNPRGLEKLLRAIQSDSRFKEKPVGPMGRHVKLLNPEWAHILEKQFGGVLNGFVVTSKPDQNVLTGLLRKFDWRAPVYIGNRNRIDTTPNEPSPELLTWKKALRIDDDLVRNQFIINQGIEQTVLIEDRTEGSRFMRARGEATRNVKMCFTFADGDKRKGRVINFTSNGGINDSPIGEYIGSLRMQVDKEDQIREEQTRLKQTRQEVLNLERACSELLNRVNSCQTQRVNHQRQKKILQVGVQRAQDKVDRLEGELSEATPDAAAIEVLEEGLATAQEELRHAEGIFEDMVLQRDKLNAEASTNLKKLQETQQVLQELEFKLNKAQSTVRKLQGQREDELKKKNKAISQVEAAQENKTIWVEAVKEAQGEVDTATKDAETVCPIRVAVPEGKTSDELIATLNRLRATRLETEKELGGSQDELLRQANAAKLTHKTAMQEFEDIRHLRNHLAHTLNNRRNRWKQFRQGISIRARVTFNYLLSERKFRGTLSIDHTKGLLDIHVQPDITERSGDGRQTKTLSGGEKSYSTVCLLLSLWDAMGSPIRCLDEFDVFMDPVNRERSMHMIIQAARRSIGRQFIFITPQSMNTVKQTSDVKIIKMSDPERGQTTLNVSRT